MPNGLVVVYIWKKPSLTSSSTSLLSRAWSIFAKPSNEVNSSEPSIRDSHIAISISTNIDNKYFSFWPEPLIQTTECGGVMHSQIDDIQRMGRKADLILILPNADTEKVLANARYFAALWVNKLHFNNLPWEKRIAGHKTYVQDNEARNDNSAVFVYNALISWIHSNKPELNPMNNMTGKITTESLSVALITHPQVIKDLSKYSDIIAKEPVVLPGYPLYLKYKEDVYKNSPLNPLQYQETVFREFTKTLSVSCISSDGKQGYVPVAIIETDYSQYDELKEQVQVELKL